MKINTTVAKPPTKRIIIAINAKGIATIDSKMRVISSQIPLIFSGSSFVAFYLLGQI